MIAYIKNKKQTIAVMTMTIMMLITIIIINFNYQEQAKSETMKLEKESKIMRNIKSIMGYYPEIDRLVTLNLH